MTLLLLTSYGSTGHCWFTASYEDKVGHTSMLFHRPVPLSKDTSSLGFSSVAQSCLTLYNPMGLQHASTPCPSPTPGVYQNSWPLSQWWHPTIPSSVVPFSCPQSFPASDLFKLVNSSHLVAKVLKFQLQHQVLPVNTQDWSPLGWTGWNSLQSKGLWRVHSSKASILRSAFFTVQLSHPYMTTGKIIALTRGTFVDKVMSLLFNMLSRLVITFPLRSKRLLIFWLQSPSVVILEPKKSLSLFPHLFAMNWWDQMPWS